MSRLKVLVVKKCIVFLVLTALLTYYCEHLIYCIVIYKCSWPNIPENDQSPRLDNINNKNVLKALIIADPHLLGPINGHWFDKLRREWQMFKSFQAGIHLFKPEVVFFLGDVFDEGQLVSNEYFERYYVKRFSSIFEHPTSVKSYVVAGNHDIGFHYRVSPKLKERFEKAFKTSAVRRVRLKNINFILINSIAMEGDGCFFCRPAVNKLHEISYDLECERDSNQKSCDKNITRPYSSPIILQHFPLFRESDSMCSGDDSAPETEKHVKFRNKLDCLSNSSSQLLLKLLKPRLVVSGHTHHGCLIYHRGTKEYSDGEVIQVPEISVPSFSWRNRNNPSFFLAHFTTENFEMSKCYLPKESTVLFTYASLGLLIVFNAFNFIPGPNNFKIRLLLYFTILTVICFIIL